MVSLALDPPPSSRDGRAPRRGPWRKLALAVVLLAFAGGGFVLGRVTAPGGRFPILVGPEVPGAGARRAPAAAAAPSAAPAAPAAASAIPGLTAPAPSPDAVAAQPGAQQAAVAPAAPVAAPAPAPAPPPVAAGPRRIAVVLNGALEESLAAAVPAPDRPMAEELTQVVNRLLVWDLQVARDGRRGDRIEVIYGPAPAGALSQEPVVEAVRYTSQKLGKTIAAYRHLAPGQKYARYYRPDGSELEERLVDVPVADYDQVTSLLRDGRRHKGVDFRTPVGTPVFATFDGVIERRNWNFGGNGNCLDIHGADGKHAIYLHLEVLPKEMVPGRAVKKGEQIALSGNSGHSFAPHLHYQLEAADGRILDPFAVQPTRRAALDPAARAGFDATRARLDAALSGTPAPAPAVQAAVPAAAPIPASATAPR